MVLVKSSKNSTSQKKPLNMKFTPHISDREDFDLILIAKNNNNNEWQPDATELARVELIKRDFSDCEIDNGCLKIFEDGKRGYGSIQGKCFRLQRKTPSIKIILSSIASKIPIQICVNKRSLTICGV